MISHKITTFFLPQNMAQAQRRKRAKLNEYFWHTSPMHINKKQTMELTKRGLYNKTLNTSLQSGLKLKKDI